MFKVSEKIQLLQELFHWTLPMVALSSSQMKTEPKITHRPRRAPLCPLRADAECPSEGDGFVRAETIQEAVALVGHPEVNV